MVTNIDIERFITNVSIALVVSGMLLLSYAAIVTAPTLSGWFLAPTAPLMGSLLMYPSSSGTVIVPFPSVSSSVLYAGSLLIVGSACLDVWRRLRRL